RAERPSPVVALVTSPTVISLKGYADLGKEADNFFAGHACRRGESWKRKRRASAPRELPCMPGANTLIPEAVMLGLTRALRNLGNEAHGRCQGLELEMRSQPGDGFIPPWLALDLADFHFGFRERALRLGLVAGVRRVGDDEVIDPVIQPALAILHLHE